MADKKLTTDEIVTQINALRLPGMEVKDKAARTKAREKYSADRAALTIQYKAALISEEASHLPEAAADAIYQKAWNDGHDSGFYGVYAHFTELVELADLILAAK
jgi:hypothetical protein